MTQSFRYMQPRSIVHINGNKVPFRSWSVELNGFNSADTFNLSIPFRIWDNLKGTTDLANTITQESILLTQPDIKIEIWVGYPNDPDNYNENDLTKIMYGYLDSLDINFGSSGITAEIQGRNLVGSLMDVKTTQKWPNLTSSGIVEYLCQEHNLTPQVTPTYTLTGTYYSNDHTQLSSDITEWDLINYLAYQEGYGIRVIEDNLYFVPRDWLYSNQAMLFTWGRDLKSLKISRNPHASRDIKVYVYSYDPHHKRNLYALAQSQTNYIEKIQQTDNRQAYMETYYISGLTQEQAQQRANQILKQLSETEITGDLSTFGVDAMAINQPIQINGLGAGIDGLSFWPTKIGHKFDNSSSSYNMDITFSNLNLPSNTGVVQ